MSSSSSSDLAFDVQGYAFILLNDAFTAASNVYTKKNLGTEVKRLVDSTQPPLWRNKGHGEQRTHPRAIIPVHGWSLCALQGLGKYGVLFYNSLIIIVPTVLASAFTGDLHKVDTGSVVKSHVFQIT